MALTRDDARAILGDFGELIGIQGLAFDETGRCALDIEARRADVRIRHDDARNELVLEGRSRLDGELTADTMAAMLERDSASDGRGAEALSVEPGDDAIRLVRWLDQVADAQQLATAIDSLITDTLLWAEQSTTTETEDSLPGTSRPEVPDPGHRV